MSTTDRPTAEDAPDASAVAAACRNAELLHLVARADGDALAAAGVLAAACAAIETPYHVSVVRTRADLDARLGPDDDEATPLVVGASAPGTGSITGPAPVSVVAYDAAVELGAEPDPTLALAGVVAAEAGPDTAAPEILDRSGLERRPGVAVPTDDLADGLAHTTLAHADFSGDVDAAREAVEGLGSDPDGRVVASLLALATVGTQEASVRSADAVERALRPYAGGQFETIGGYADVLCALAGTSPGLAVTLALGADGTDAALDAWREHAIEAHATVREAETARHSGLLVARLQADGATPPVDTAARLLRDFRSPEPVVLALADGEAGVAATEGSVEEAIETAAAAAGGSALGRGPTGHADFDPDQTEAFVDAFRGAL